MNKEGRLLLLKSLKIDCRGMVEGKDDTYIVLTKNTQPERYYKNIMIDKEYLNEWVKSGNITEQEVIEYRKYNYWRGFRACVTILTTIILLTMFVLGSIISKRIDRDMREWEQQQIEVGNIVDLNK